MAHKKPIDPNERMVIAIEKSLSLISEAATVLKSVIASQPVRSRKRLKRSAEIAIDQAINKNFI